MHSGTSLAFSLSLSLSHVCFFLFSLSLSLSRSCSLFLSLSSPSLCRHAADAKHPLHSARALFLPIPQIISVSRACGQRATSDLKSENDGSGVSSAIRAAILAVLACPTKSPQLLRCSLFHGKLHAEDFGLFASLTYEPGTKFSPVALGLRVGAHFLGWNVSEG